ncbi:hypothetical protein AV530_000178 [Patagioenas fasciata monilis]|uniref:Uncharacterized protein n=1 Tax=Patagioenas fasciata monilis TaxID=372326 RepID=A0A1V4K994_PATFA|nr:hypothetical protein AV530_000178 [Patagioenas fasciata monilis]
MHRKGVVDSGIRPWTSWDPFQPEGFRVSVTRNSSATCRHKLSLLNKMNIFIVEVKNPKLSLSWMSR